MCERREERTTENPGGRSYDELTPSKLVLPNGGLVAYQDRALAGPLGREVLALWHANVHADTPSPQQSEVDDSWGGDF